MKRLLLNEALWSVNPGPDRLAVVRMVGEIGKNSSNKYEYDANLPPFRLDRALWPMHFPGAPSNPRPPQTRLHDHDCHEVPLRRAGERSRWRQTDQAHNSPGTFGRTLGRILSALPLSLLDQRAGQQWSGFSKTPRFLQRSN